MGLSSSTLALPKKAGTKAKSKTSGLLMRHRKAIDKVVADAKTFSDDRKRDLEKIADEGLRQSAAR